MEIITIVVPIIVSPFLCETATRALEKGNHMFCCLIVVIQTILISITVNAITSL